MADPSSDSGAAAVTSAPATQTSGSKPATKLTPQERARQAAGKRRARQGNGGKSKDFASLYCSLVSVVVAVWAVFIFRAFQPPAAHTLTEADITSARVRLPDGRHMAYHEMGASADAARYHVLVVHAWQTCRLSMLPNVTESWLQRHGIRLVSYDRAGYGQSDPDAQRTLQSDVRDADEVARQLSMGDRYFLLATSMGAYVALGALKYIPHRLLGATLVSGVVNPWDPSMHTIDRQEAWQKLPVTDRLTLLFARHAPRLLHPWLSQTLVPMGNFREPFHPHPLDLSESDMAALESPVVDEYFRTHLSEGMRQGPQLSWFRDLEILTTRWGFGVGEIDLDADDWPEEKPANGEQAGEGAAAGVAADSEQWGGILGKAKKKSPKRVGLKGRVHVWHGEEDRGVPRGYAIHIHQAVRGVKLHLLKGRGHFFMYNDEERPKEVLLTMLGIDAAAAAAAAAAAE